MSVFSPAFVGGLLSILAFQNGDPVREQDVLYWGGLALLVGVGIVDSKILQSKGIHLTFGNHRRLPYVLIFPLIAIIPALLFLGWRQAVGPVLCGAIGLYLILFHVVGAACPECGGRLRNLPRRSLLFHALRQVRYQCKQCGFQYDRFDTEDPPF